MDMKVSAKRKDTGKWWIFGNLKSRNYEGREQLQLSFKVTPELKEYMELALQDEWINFALFENESKRQESSAAADSGSDDIDDTVPF